MLALLLLAQVDHATATIVAEHPSVAPGGKITVGLRVEMDAGWHIYWTNPGDSGMSASAKWMAPKDIKIRALAWPAPHRVPQGPLMMYGYEGVVLMLAEVSVPADFKGTSIAISVAAEWLVCADVCLNGGSNQSLSIPVKKGRAAPNEKWLKLFAKARTHVPRKVPARSLRVHEEEGTLQLRLDAKLLSVTETTHAYFFPVRADVVAHAKEQKFLLTEDAAILVLPRSGRKPYRSLGGKSLVGVLVLKEGNKRRAFAVEVPISVNKPNEASK